MYKKPCFQFEATVRISQIKSR